MSELISAIQSLKLLASQVLGPFYGELLAFVSIAVPFFGANNFNWMFIVSTIVIAALFFWRCERGPKTLRGFWQFLLPKSVFWHPSAKVDYQFYFVNALFLRYARLGGWIAAGVGLLYLADFVEMFVRFIGVTPLSEPPSWVARLIYTVALVIAIDFAKFLTHFLQHKSALLWEFHKVHHSAEVLTPVTNLRLHPVDFALEQFLVGIIAAVPAGVFAALYAGEVAEITIMSFSFIIFIYFLQSNFRHSHIPITFPGWLSPYLCSPLMHQVHHSSETRHWDKNFSLIFSFWDRMASSLYVPAKDETFVLGLPKGESRDFSTIGALYLQPFRLVLRKLLPSRERTT